MICGRGCIYRDPDGTCQKFTDDEYHSFCVDGPCEYAKPSNGDRIRAMTDEELAEWFYRIQQEVSDYYCGIHSGEPPLPTRKESWLDWLKQEAEA